MSRGGTCASRVPLSALEWVAVIGLAGLGCIYLFQFFFVWLVRGGLLLPILLLSLAAFTFAGLIWLHVAWAPVASAVLALVGLAIGFAIDSATLAYPTAQPGRFVTFVVELALLLTTLAMSVILALPALQPLRGGGGRTPRWLAPALAGITGLALGMIVIALVAAAHPVGGPSTSSVNGTPTVHMAGADFTTNVALVPKGERLTLVDDDGMRHIIRNGFWTDSKPQPQVEPGSPIVDQDITSGAATIGPFMTPGVYHLYCVIHRGMNLTVVVQ